MHNCKLNWTELKMSVLSYIRFSPIFRLEESKALPGIETRTHWTKDRHAAVWASAACNALDYFVHILILMFKKRITKRDSTWCKVMSTHQWNNWKQYKTKESETRHARARVKKIHSWLMIACAWLVPPVSRFNYPRVANLASTGVGGGGNIKL